MDIRVDHFIHMVPGSDDILTKLNQLITQGDTIMATLSDLNQKIADLTVAISAERSEVQGLLSALRTQIQALQDQLATGAVVSQADLDALGTALDAVIAQVQAISEPQV